MWSFFVDGSPRLAPRGEAVVEQGQRHHRGRQEDGVAHGQAVTAGRRRRRQQTRTGETNLHFCFLR